MIVDRLAFAVTILHNYRPCMVSIHDPLTSKYVGSDVLTSNVSCDTRGSFNLPTQCTTILCVIALHNCDSCFPVHLKEWEDFVS